MRTEKSEGGPSRVRMNWKKKKIEKEDIEQ